MLIPSLEPFWKSVNLSAPPRFVDLSGQNGPGIWSTARWKPCCRSPPWIPNLRRAEAPHRFHLAVSSNMALGDICLFYKGNVCEYHGHTWTFHVRNVKMTWTKSQVRINLCEQVPSTGLHIVVFKSTYWFIISLLYYWLVLWNMTFIFPFSWEFHNPNWRNHIFQRGRYTTNQIMRSSLFLWVIFFSFVDLQVSSRRWLAVSFYFWLLQFPCQTRVFVKNSRRNSDTSQSHTVTVDIIFQPLDENRWVFPIKKNIREWYFSKRASLEKNVMFGNGQTHVMAMKQWGHRVIFKLNLFWHMIERASMWIGIYDYSIVRQSQNWSYIAGTRWYWGVATMVKTMVCCTWHVSRTSISMFIPYWKMPPTGTGFILGSLIWDL